METSRVALVPVNTYEQPAVDAAVREAIGLLGGIGQFVQQEEKILLKPNLLARVKPQKAITTHPAVFAAVARLLREEGYRHLSYGDSPGNPATSAEKAADESGITAAAEQFAIPMGDFSHGSTMLCEDGRVSSSFCLCNGVIDADALINLPKMKTHALERITGGVKNLYGCVWSFNKAVGHAKHPNSESFADMLCDLNRMTKARLHVMDGITAMEGNGPASGTPVQMNMILASADPVALDSVFAALVHLDPTAVPTCVSGEAAGIGVMDHARITVLTPDGALTVAQAAEKYGNPRFDVFRGRLKKSILNNVGPLLPIFQERPRVDRNKCVGCGICEEACPVEHKAVHAGKGQKARYDYQKCIRCYCCQEMCPAKAITVHYPLLSRFLK